MTSTKRLLINSFAGGFSQILIIALRFISRTFLVKYIGVEVLGISGTLASLISALSLAELGFQGAIVYRLYKPIGENDYERCNELLLIYKRIYTIIALIIAVLMLVLLPFLKFFLKGIEINSFVYILYAISGGNVVVSYLLAYKRSLLYVDQKDSIAKTVDCICNLLFISAGIVIVYFTRSYIYYMLIQVLQTIASNLIIHLFCKKLYKWQAKVAVKKETIKDIFKDVKNIFANRIAIYVYTATDNLVISSFVGTIMVGFYSNYLMITSSLKGIVNSVLTQVTPFIGRNYALNSEKKDLENYLMVYTFARFLIAGMVANPLFILVPGFVNWWLGSDYIMKNIGLLLCIEMYIDFVHSALCDYISVSGHFAYEKRISIVGASCNIVSSIIFVKFFGVQGVLFGTILSQSVFWILRTYTVLNKIFKSNKSFVFEYILKNIFYALITVFAAFITYFITKNIHFNFYLFEFVLKGLFSVIIFTLCVFIFFFKTKELKFMAQKLLKRK